jgi:hypothetical protein
MPCGFLLNASEVQAILYRSGKKSIGSQIVALKFSNITDKNFMIHKYFGVFGILLIGMTGCTGSPSTVARSPAAAITKISKVSDDLPPAKESSTPQLVAKQTSKRLVLSKVEVSYRQTVADYFLAMPAKYLTDPASKRITDSKRQQMLAGAKGGEAGGIYDLKNGYLSLIEGGDTCNLYTIAIFNRPTRSPLVARNISCTIGDAVVILDPAQNWKDVTKAVLPVDLTPSPDLKYTISVVLPRTGRIIEVLHENEDGSKKPIGRYRFEGQRFVKE